jgi:hypothetical protein
MSAEDAAFLYLPCFISQQAILRTEAVLALPVVTQAAAQVVYESMDAPAVAGGVI